MVKDVNIHVSYGSRTTIIIGSRRNFLSKVSDHFRIPLEEIEIYEINKNVRKLIEVDDLRDVMKVEIKHKAAGRKSNGHRIVNHNEASTSRSYNEEIIQKLQDNTTLTGSERKHLLKLLQEDSFPTSLKRKENDTETVAPVPKKNAKIQVDPTRLISIKSTETQTDEWIQTSQKASTSANDLIIQCKRLASTEKADPAKVRDFMNKTYDERRNFILIKLPTVSFVKEKHPLLFSLAEVRNEIERIFYHDKCSQFIKNIEKYAIHILDMAREDDPLLSTTKRKMESFITPAQKKYALEVGSLLMLSSLMNEDRGYLKLTDENIVTSSFPYIEANTKLHGIYFDQHLFQIYAEGHFICEAADFKEAILCLIAIYYIFNIQYPDTNFNTFVAFEKLYLEAMDTVEIDDYAMQIIKCLQLKAQSAQDTSKK